MYDSVNFWVDRADMAGGNPFDILPYLSEITEKRSESGGYSCTGTVRGYSVCALQSGVSVNGSLAKFFFDGENVSTMTRRATQEAISNLGDVLHIDMKRAKVVRADIATVIPTKFQPAYYYGYLGDKVHFKRLQADADTLYYNNHQRVLIFYDKGKEAAGNMPDVLKDDSLFRYELRFIRRVSAQMKTDVRGETLYNPSFYEKIVMRWYDEFRTIRKIKKQNVMTKQIETVRDAETALFAHLLQQAGHGIIDNFIDDLKMEKKFKNRERYSELKRKLNTIYASLKGEPSELGEELEKWIYEQAKYAR